MKTLFLFVIVLAPFMLNLAAGQQPGIQVTFSADNNGQAVSLDSVLVKNLSKNSDTMLHAPYLSLMLDTLATGTGNNYDTGNQFTVSQNYPNPFNGRTSFGINLPESENITVTVLDIMGREVARFSRNLDAGQNFFTLQAGYEGYYLIKVIYREITQTIKALNTGGGNGQNVFELLWSGCENKAEQFKTVLFETCFDFDPGDNLLLIGYTGTDESGLVDSPTESRNYEFQFAHNMPCPGLDSLYYWGRYYHTIQVYSQCWMQENLEAGAYIPGTENQTNNGIIEKYCYGDNQFNCTTKGGLYLWDEMMQYSTVEGSRGICPEGWHIATDEEWKILEGIADSEYNIGHMVWNLNLLRGLDAGKNLKSTYGWYSPGNGTDLYGFTGLSTGYWYEYGFWENTMEGFYWTSSRLNNLKPYLHGLVFSTDKVGRNPIEEICGAAVRCLRDLEEDDQ